MGKKQFLERLAQMHTVDIQLEIVRPAVKQIVSNLEEGLSIENKSVSQLIEGAKRLGRWQAILELMEQ